MQYVRLNVIKNLENKTKEEFYLLGLRDIHSIEEGERVEVCGFCDGELTSLPEGAVVEAVEPIDWSAQWEAHAPNFHEGRAHLLVGQKEIRLCPGPGFGDLSHPTTRLVLEMMEGAVQGKRVLDIGCGSGVLSLAAEAAGAAAVCGTDIDRAALDHARENARENGMNRILFQAAEESLPFEPEVVLFNMIPEQQKEAWPPLSAVQVISSGVPVERREEYLSWAASQGWALLEERQQQGWLGFCFG